MDNIKIKYSKIIPFPGFFACQIWGTVFIRKEFEGQPVSQTTINHENTHLQQALDFGIGKLGFIPFYLEYFLEWLFKLPLFIWRYDPYYNLAAEQEAYDHQTEDDYNKTRKRFAWLKNIFKLRK